MGTTCVHGVCVSGGDSVLISGGDASPPDAQASCPCLACATPALVILLVLPTPGRRGLF